MIIDQIPANTKSVVKSPLTTAPRALRNKTNMRRPNMPTRT